MREIFMSPAQWVRRNFGRAGKNSSSTARGQVSKKMNVEPWFILSYEIRYCLLLNHSLC